MDKFNLGSAVEAFARSRKANAKQHEDFLVQDLGKGPQLVFWDTKKLGRKPTNDELEKALAQVSAKRAQKEEKKNRAKQEMRKVGKPERGKSLEERLEALEEIVKDIILGDED